MRGGCGEGWCVHPAQRPAMPAASMVPPENALGCQVFERERVRIIPYSWRVIPFMERSAGGDSAFRAAAPCVRRRGSPHSVRAARCGGTQAKASKVYATQYQSANWLV